VVGAAQGQMSQGWAVENFAARISEGVFGLRNRSCLQRPGFAQAYSRKDRQVSR